MGQRDRKEAKMRGKQMKAFQNPWKPSRKSAKKKKKSIRGPGCFFLSILPPSDTLVENVASVCSFGKVLPYHHRRRHDSLMDKILEVELYTHNVLWQNFKIMLVGMLHERVFSLGEMLQVFKNL